MTTRYRLKFNFWLNISDPIEAAIADTIELLKTNRLFAKTIRDGIRLIHDLRKGSLDVLFEMFPYVKSEFLKYIQDVVGQGRTEGDIDRAHDSYQHTQHLKDMIALQNEEIERLTHALEKARSKPSEEFEAMINRAVSQAISKNTLQSANMPKNSDLKPIGGLRPIAGANNAPMPIFDDTDDEDLLEVKVDTDAPKRVAQNFLNTLKAVQSFKPQG